METATMDSIEHLFANNQAWAAAKKAEDADFFARLSRQQKPKFLWIGCADSRVPANEIVGLMPGELFVHRNVANVVVHTDLNCLSVLDFAVDILKVRHVVVCGHYGCSGVAAVVENSSFGICDHWLRHVGDVACKHAACLVEIADAGRRMDHLCELNVIEQVRNVCRTSIVQHAWARGQELSVHGVIYALSDGILRSLDVTISSDAELALLPHHFHASRPASPHRLESIS
jgi:carbonic anhydrase